jgi:hypothetical protein
MTARLVRYASRAQLLNSDRAAEARQIILQFEAVAPHLVGQVMALIDRHTMAEKGWSFVMLSPAQNRLVVRWINEHAKRPRVSAALWADFFCNMRTDTGEVVMTRAQMMEATNASSSHVSDVLTELSGMGALIRLRQGREVRWFMNPRVGTHLTGVAREEAQRAAPPLLSVINGGSTAR